MSLQLCPPGILTLAVGCPGAEEQQSTFNETSARAHLRRVFTLLTRAQSKFFRFQIEHTDKIDQVDNVQFGG